MAVPNLESKAVGICVFPGVEELDFVGPWEVFTMWRSYASGPARIETIAESSEPIVCAKGLKIIPDVSVDNAPDYDFFLLPGGFAALEMAKRASFLEFVKRQASTASATLSVCSGAWILYAAGLLNGKRATTHWKLMQELADQPDVEAVSRRYVRDGNIWTSAGVSAGIDMSLAFVAAVAGEDAAGIVQLNSEYYPDGRVYDQAGQQERMPPYTRAMQRQDRPQ